MAASAYTPSAEFPTYADYRRAKQREHRKAWKLRNAAAYAESENARRKAKYAADPEFKAKVNANNLAAYRANPEPAKARSKAVREANTIAVAEYQKTYYAENKLTLKQYKSGWAKRNGASVNRRNSARRALCKQATPVWADMQDITDVYLEAKHMQMHVDHIVPLNHPLVCGLHVWDNLQLLTPLDNMRKNNKFDPEAFNAS